jgi:hypothetical protein
VLEASVDAHGVAGILPTVVTDGGAAVLVVVLLGFLIRYRTPWARQRTGPAGGPPVSPAEPSRRR